MAGSSTRKRSPTPSGTAESAIAALDVRAHEPPNPDNDPLAGLPNLILTPHMAGASVEAREALHHMTADVSLAILRAGGQLAERQAEAAATAC